MKQHGGHVDVRSEPGTGTTFEIFLPRLVRPSAQSSSSHERGHVAPPPSAPAAEPHDVTDSRAAGSALTVLVVDDDPSVRAVLETMLRQENYRVLGSSDPEEALALARELGDELDVLVTDVMMPKLNGHELYQRIVREHPKLRVLFVSGFAADVISEQGGLEAGLELVQKPFSAATLHAKLRKVLSGAR
jgi:CheY-like chemotaxis protein